MNLEKFRSNYETRYQYLYKEIDVNDSSMQAGMRVSKPS
jgi:hypothetical protein